MQAGYVRGCPIPAIIQLIDRVDDCLCLAHGQLDDFRQLHQGLVVTVHLQTGFVEVVDLREYKLYIEVIRVVPQMSGKRFPRVVPTHHLHQHVGVYLDARVAKLADAGCIALHNVRDRRLSTASTATPGCLTP